MNNETQHTAGPWRIDEFAQIVTDATVLGKVYCGDIFPSGNEEWDANAQLIASAPSLLKENQDIKETLNDTHKLIDEYKESLKCKSKENQELKALLKEIEIDLNGNNTETARRRINYYKTTNL
jgi:hypothetical protein